MDLPGLEDADQAVAHFSRISVQEAQKMRIEKAQFTSTYHLCKGFYFFSMFFLGWL